MNVARDLLLILVDVGIWLVAALFAGFGLIFVAALFSYFRKKDNRRPDLRFVIICGIICILSFSAFIACTVGAVRLIEIVGGQRW